MASLLATCGAWATDLPEAIKRDLGKRDEKVQIRFDGLVTFSNGTQYLPVLPQGLESASQGAETGDPKAATDGKRKLQIPEKAKFPDLIEYDNQWFLLRLVPLGKGQFTLPRLAEYPIELKEGLLPQDLVLPSNLVVPVELKVILGDLPYKPDPSAVAASASGGVSSDDDDHLPDPTPKASSKNGGIPVSVQVRTPLAIPLTPSNAIPTQQPKGNAALYTVSLEQSTLYGYTMEGGKPTFSLPLNCTPSDLATSRDGNFVFATCLSSDEVIALDTQSGLVRNRIAVGSRPFHLTWSPDGKTLLVSNRYSNFLTPIDSSALVAGPKIDLPGRGGVVSVAQGPQNSFWVFVGDSASSDVYILQAKNSPEGLTTEYIRTLKALPGISGLWFNPAAGRQGELWFISRTENKAGVIDIATNTVRTTIDLGEKPIDMVAVNQELFVVSAASHRLDVIEIPTGQLKTPIFLADDVFPSGLVLANDGRTAYIPSANSKKITVIDLDLQQVVKSLDMATPSIAATLVQPGLSAMDTQANATTGAQMPEESIESVRPDGEQATPAASPDLKANQKKPWFRWTW